MPAKLLDIRLPHKHTRSTSSTDISSPQKAPSKPKSGPSSPTTPQRPKLPRAASHPGPSPASSPNPSFKSKPPGRAFGTNYRVRRTPPGSPPNGPSQTQHQTQTQPLGPALAHSNVRDFAKLSSSAAHSQPARRKPVYSLHEADPAAKGRPEVVYTDAELLKRLNTIGEGEEEDVERVRTVERERDREWEAERRRKEEREMEEWNARGARKGKGSLSRGFSWKGVKSVVGGFR